MLVEGNSNFNLYNDKFVRSNTPKTLNNPENATSGLEKLPPNELNSTGKCVYGPVNDINLIDKSLSKCEPVDPAMFENFFYYADIDQAKNLVKSITNTSDKAEFADKVNDFYKLVNHMDKHELIETAEYLGEQMRHTDGRDDILGSLLMGVLNEVKSREKPQYQIMPSPYKMQLLDF
jgi:hypothetical protein